MIFVFHILCLFVVMLLGRVSAFAGSRLAVLPRCSLFTSTALQAVKFRSGDKIIVEVNHFGPLGASVDILEDDSEQAAIVGSGMILQQDIHKFRQSRDYVDVVVGEVLDGFVQRVRQEDGKVDVSLFPVGVNKLNTVREMILNELDANEGRLEIGEKSPPEAIEELFGVGVSKSSFKKALGMLYKEQVIKRPGAHDVELQ
mmetsp:Transcript_21988/g.45810  ORF Transcript_21988/g.45810 Transcript_21988/m.45810 type:complete len:200 (-) Transcript_21988:26-625(-)